MQNSHLNNRVLAAATACARLLPGGRRPPEPHNILVVRLGNVGDIVVALPAFHAIRRRFPEARITLLTSPTQRGAPGALEVLADDTTFDDRIVYYADESRRPAFLRRLRREIVARRIDLAVALPNHLTGMHNLGKHAALLAASGVRRFAGFRVATPRDNARPQVDRLMELLMSLGIQGPEPLPWLHPGAEAEARAEALLAPAAGTTLIGMHCGAKRPANQWFPESFADLGQRLAERHGVRIVLTGAPSEAALTARVATDTGEAAIDLAGKASIPELAAVARRCRLFISNDTGAMHVAYAAGAPVLALFSARFHPHVWYPYSPGHRVLRASVECSPCHADICPRAERPPCLEAITVDAAFAAATEMLNAEA